MLRRLAAHLGASSSSDSPAKPTTAAVADEREGWAGTLAPRSVTRADYPSSAERSPELSPAEAEHFREFGCASLLPLHSVPANNVMSCVCVYADCLGCTA